MEDKVVQAAVVRVLSQLWEGDFLDFLYGFRPGRSRHDALDTLYAGSVGADHSRRSRAVHLSVKET